MEQYHELLEMVKDFVNALFVPDWPLPFKVVVTILALKGIFSRWL